MLDPGLPQHIPCRRSAGPRRFVQVDAFLFEPWCRPRDGCDDPSKPVSCHDVHTSQYQLFKKETQNLGFSGKIAEFWMIWGPPILRNLHMGFYLFYFCGTSPRSEIVPALLGYPDAAMICFGLPMSPKSTMWVILLGRAASPFRRIRCMASWHHKKPLPLVPLVKLKPLGFVDVHPRKYGIGCNPCP